MSLKEKFESEIEKCDWDMLKPHHERGAVFIVGESLELVTVAMALAEDNVSQVKIWLDNKDFYKLEETSEFEKEPFRKFAHFLIVQPYVLVKIID
ncbi:MAG: hypothetical protein CME65_13490 [Halobacteriovoraceae bacterium]|nr:hypothetical protein [Halobacteriovoraceae bacterium]|tara:strand:+ start:8517 stop:8801 length:285 start_codon:yes stop_codon:yes gene_type:complete